MRGPANAYRYNGPSWAGQQLVVELSNEITETLAEPLERAITDGTPYPGAYEAATGDIYTPQLHVRLGYPNASGDELVAMAGGLDDDDARDELVPYG